MNTWLEAQVIGVSDAKVQVHYKGWKAKFDEWLGPDRIAPLHTHTRRLPGGVSQLAVGLHLDVHDTTETWLEGEIIQLQRLAPGGKLMAQVRYKGWGSKYDEWLDEDSYRMAPLHTHTQAYKRVPHMTAQPQQACEKPLQASQSQEEQFAAQLATKSWSVVHQDPDGNCLFRSIAHQVYGDPELHALIRQKCCDYLEAERTFFGEFVEGEFSEYVSQMRCPGHWGDHTEIQALSELYDRPIEVYAYSLTPMNTYNNAPRHNVPIRLSYHFQSHYNSIVTPTHTSSIMDTTPGMIEDLQINESKRRGGRVQAAGGDPELTAALAASRQLFERNVIADFDAAVHASLMSQPDQLNLAIAQSLGLNLGDDRKGPTIPADDPDQQMAIAISQSLEANVNHGNDDLALALAASAREAERDNADRKSVV